MDNKERVNVVNVVDKPPLGLMPRPLYLEEANIKGDLCRYTEVKRAVKRYMDAGFPVPQEWIDEYHLILAELVEIHTK